jgi:hypothetical protein
MGSGAGRGGDQDQDRQRNAWLPEDDVAWGTDPGAGPAVVGRSDEKPARTPRDRPRGPRGTAPTGPVRPPMPGREQA